MPLTSFVALALIGQQAPVMTVDQALELANKNAFALRIAKNRQRKSSDNLKAAKGSLYPRVDLSGAYSYQDTEFTSIGGGAVANFGPSGWNAYKSATLTLSQSVDVNRLARRQVDVYRYQDVAEQQNILTEENGLRSNVRFKYLTLLQDIELAKVQQEEVKAAAERLAKANIRFEAGSVPKFEVIRLEDDEKRAEQALVSALAEITLAKQDLNNTIGIPIETDYTPEPVKSQANLVKGPDELVVSGLRNRSEIKQTEALVFSLENAAKVATNNRLPQLTVNATRTQYLDAPAGTTDTFTQLQAKVSLNLFDSGQTNNQVHAAERDVEQARIQLEQIQLAVALDVRRSATNAKTALTNIDLAHKNVELTRESLRLAQLRYDEGSGILLDVITAQADYTSAEAAEINANYQFLQAFAALQHAVGSDDLLPHGPLPVTTTTHPTRPGAMTSPKGTSK